MVKEAVDMQSLGIELQNKITQGQEKVKNIETYTREIEVVIEDSWTEKAKFKAVIEKKAILEAEEAVAKKEREKIKRKMTARNNRERQKSQQLEVEEMELHQRTQSQARIDEEMFRATNEITEQFNAENDSRIIDNSLINEMEDELSVKSEDKILLDELFDGEQRADQFHNLEVDQSRVSIKEGIDISFFSDAGRGQGSDHDDGDAFNFDALMKEKVARQSIKEERLDLETDGGEALHYQTPDKPSSALHFETDESVKQLTMAKPETVTVLDLDKSATEPDQFSVSRQNDQNTHTTSV